MVCDDLFNPFPNRPWFFICLQYKSFENTVGKGEIACDKQFLLFPHHFLPFGRNFCHFHQILNCRLLTPSVWKSLKFVVWEKVKALTLHKSQNATTCSSGWAGMPVSVPLVRQKMA